MKFLVLVALTLTSQIAQADTFACELKNGFNISTGYESNRERQATALARPFVCVGKAENGYVTVILASTESDNSSVVRSGQLSATAELTGLDIHGDGIDTATCTCDFR